MTTDMTTDKANEFYREFITQWLELKFKLKFIPSIGLRYDNDFDHPNVIKVLGDDECGKEDIFVQVTKEAMLCFYLTTKEGTACSVDHWRQYRVCLTNAIYDTGAPNSIFDGKKSYELELL